MLLIGIGVSLLVGSFIWGIFRNFDLLLSRATPFPIDLHSVAQANYQKDPAFMKIPPMDIQLVVDAIWDQNENVQVLAVQLTHVNENFLAQVSTVTPRPTFTNTPVGSELTPSTTVFPGTDLPPSFTPSITPAGFVASSTPTSPGALPTETSSAPSATTISATETSVPPTNTPLPPTNTISPCGQLSASGFNVETGTKKASWSINNGSSSPVTLSTITINWPSANGDLSKVKFGNTNAWSGSAPPPSKTINGSWPLGGNSSQSLVFFFINDALTNGYTLSLAFSNGCTLYKSN